ncbi:unnamed protein product [Symbiodinium necroappetens]|uniref:Uncharacterized protein n=1 Tax=Symbiodinium necroappetens TaxID=1628268 RepID=A0A813A9N5_9DINO|nr:unnamed protein product [Symbiodinium necroappetens]
MPRAQKRKTAQDVELTDVDSDSDMDLKPVRLPSGLPLDDPPSQISANNHLEVEQVFRRHLDNGYIPMSVFSWLAQTLPSELLRASALTRRGAPAMAFSVGAYYHAGTVGIRSNTKKYPCTAALLAHMVRACTHSNFTAVSLLRNLNMATHVDRKNTDQTYPRKANIKDITNTEYNHSIRVKSMALADAHSLACDMSIQRNVDQAPEIIAYTILEVTFDLRAVVSLAQTNKTTWIRCSQVLRAASTECKIKTNAPWHKRAGRAVDKDAPETPIDIKMYLFNKRMHNWYHHELSYQQYLDLQVRELLPTPET